MTPMPDVSKETCAVIGELCVCGDQACARGDLGALRHFAQQLASYMPEPTHCELVELARACSSDPGRAVELWDRLKPRLYRSADA